MDSNHNILEEIIENVNKSGSHEIPFKVLEEHAFKPTLQPRRSTAEQILIWAVENKLLFEYKKIDGATIVRFYKKIK
jgi:hypothetical protein